jgi:glycosyltransferase involved in cell wall biosynthesis
MKIVHIDTEMEWRGGQQQVAYLHEHLHKMQIKTLLICQPKSQFENYCKNSNLPYIALKMMGELDVVAAFKIARLCRTMGYKVLQLHSAHALSIGLLAKLFFRELKLVAVRRVDFHIRKNVLSNIKYRNSLLNKIICISNGVKKVLIEDGISEDKLITIYSGIDLNKFEETNLQKGFKKQLGIPEKNILIGTIAAIVGHKDYPNLIKAAKIVLEKNRNVTFCAYGTGNLEQKMKSLVKALNIESSFIFAGFRKDVGDFLRNCDLSSSLSTF